MTPLPLRATLLPLLLCILALTSRGEDVRGNKGASRLDSSSRVVGEDKSRQGRSAEKKRGGQSADGDTADFHTYKAWFPTSAPVGPPAANPTADTSTNSADTAGNATASNSGAASSKGNKQRPLNIIMMLADDLGYGDTSVAPFSGSGIYTPELEKMASRGAVMTNFHTAAGTCTPTRASLLTGLYPWRLGIKAVYEYGTDKHNRNDWLPLVPTAAMAFRQSGYFTGHSGKWHLGGMRDDDLDMRTLNKSFNPFIGNGRRIRGERRCPHPGPNQQGFHEYVSVLDGPGSPRQNAYQVNSKLHSAGCEILLRNDEPVGKKARGGETLSDCEAKHAVRMMTESVRQRQPFYLQLWFHAPHGPWETLPGYKQLYNEQECRKKMNGSVCDKTVGWVPRSAPDVAVMAQYKTMVTAMDKSIGEVLRAVKSLGIQRHTLIVFLSDNGPEDIAGLAGTTAGYRGRKRSVYEGGVRVPAIFQWTGTIPRGSVVDSFGLSTDLFPTFMDAAGLPLPANMPLDGMSLLPALTGGGKHYPVSSAYSQAAQERVSLWMNDFEGPRSASAWLFDFKLMFDEADLPSELYDMRNDPFERSNLLLQYKANNYSVELYDSAAAGLSFSLEALRNRRAEPALHAWIVSRCYRALAEWAQHGNEAHVLYLQRHPWRSYKPSIKSDQRHAVGNPYKRTSRERAERERQHLLFNTSCASGRADCACEVPSFSTVAPLPFDETFTGRQYLRPRGFLNGSALLGLTFV